MPIGGFTIKYFLQYREYFPYLREHIIELVLIAVTSYLLGQVCLSKYREWRKLPPGPMGLPIVGYLPFLGDKSRETLAQMSKTYGKIIGIQFGLNYVVVLNEYELVKEVLMHPGSLDREQYLFGRIPTGFLSENGQQWVEERRFCMHFMRNLGFGRKRWENLIEDSTMRLSEEIITFNGQPVDISEKLHIATSNNILALLLGRKLSTDSEMEKITLCTQYSDVFLNYVQTFRTDSLIPGFRSLCESLGLLSYGRAARIISAFVQLVKDEIRKHNTILDYKYLEDFINIYNEKMINAKIAGTSNMFSDSRLLGDVSILFLASSDTVFSSIGWLIRLMAEYQDVQKKVQRELDDIIGRDGHLSFDERGKLPYTVAVMMESQRFSSIVPISTTRVANQDFEVRGHIIPRGSSIMTNLWALHHDPNYFENPDQFVPERFLSKDENKVNRNVPSFAPFSLGRRNCPGETMAYMVIFLFMMKLLQRFTISPPPGEKTEFRIVGGLVQYLMPQKLCFTARN